MNKTLIKISSKFYNGENDPIATNYLSKVRNMRKPEAPMGLESSNLIATFSFLFLPQAKDTWTGDSLRF